MKNVLQLSLFEQLSQAAPRLSDEDIVRRICDDLIQEADVRPPVNVRLLASMRGIARIEEREQPWAGVLAPRGDQFFVGVRASDGAERQRFTILHEAGHTLLPGFAESRQYRCDGPKTREEQLCDIAASELLFPRQYFRDDLRAARPGLPGVEDLANAYEASIEATALRTADLAEVPTALIVLRMAHKPAERGKEDSCEPKLRVAWSHAQGAWPYIPRHKSAREASPFFRAYNGEVVDEVGVLEDLTGAGCDPVHISARRYGNDGRVLALVRQAPRGIAA